MVNTTEIAAKVERMQSAVIPRDVVLQHVNRAKVFELRGRQICNARAQSKPLPGAAASAFTSGPIMAGGRIVQRVTPAHFAVLQGVDSPLLKMMENVAEAPEKDGSKKTSMDWTDKDQWIVCHVFTSDIEVLYDLMESKGADAVKKAAVKEFGMNADVAASVSMIMAAVLEQMHRHIKTKIQFAADLEAGREISFFREQPDN